MDNKAMILVVEDDRPIRNFICVSLGTEGYQYIETQTGKSAITLIASHNPDVVILDLGLPDIDGLEVIKKVREWSQTKIIVVSARGHDREKVEALDAGADDYLTKPFSIGELMARIRVALRQIGRLREQSNSLEAQKFIIGELEMDFVKRRIYIDKQEIHLTPIEYNILTLMAQNAGKVLTHHFILKSIWGSYTESDTKSLRVFMANIRRKLEKEPAQPRYILTEVRVGYRLADE